MNLPKNLRVLLVEDNPGFSFLLQLLLHELGLSNIMVASNFEQGWEFFDSARADICILDIDLGPGQKSGIHLAEKIRTQDQLIPIIYLTANYTEDSYESSRHTRPSNFLNKEISRFKIQQALDLALLHHETLPIQKNIPPLAPPLITGNQFFFKIGDMYKAIPVKDVAYFFADHKLTYAKVGQRNYPTNVQLKTLEEEFFHIDVLELDELWSFVYSKAHKRWIWIAICRRTRQVVSFFIGDRSADTCRKFWNLIPKKYRRCRSFSDFWEAYSTVIDTGKHKSVGKETGQTCHVERWNNTLRQRICRFVRKTLSFSKSDQMHELYLLLFVYNYNLSLKN